MLVKVKENASELYDRKSGDKFYQALKEMEGKILRVDTDYLFDGSLTVKFVSKESKKEAKRDKINLVGTSVGNKYFEATDKDKRIGRQFCSYCNHHSPLVRSNGTKINTCPHCHNKGYLKPFQQNSPSYPNIPVENLDN